MSLNIQDNDIVSLYGRLILCIIFRDTFKATHLDLKANFGSCNFIYKFSSKKTKFRFTSALNVLLLFVIKLIKERSSPVKLSPALSNTIHLKFAKIGREYN